MDAATRDLIAALHAGPYSYALVASGGGTSVAAWLLAVPGGSRTILEIQVPYHTDALTAYLGRQPESFCSAETSRALAARALERARHLAPRSVVMGVACTASLRSDRPKRGDHRFHLALDTGLKVTTYSLTLVKEARDREGEEDVLDRLLLNALAETVGISSRLSVPLLPGEEPQIETQEARTPLSNFFQERCATVRVESDGRTRVAVPTPGLLLPGSFNPIHEGHWQMAAVASRQTGREAAFELTVRNADKPPLTDEEVRWRLTQFSGGAPVWLTRAATFTEKAALFPETIFVIGADTAARVLQPRFYGDSAERLNQALSDFAARGCRFLVAGRLDEGRRFLGLEDLEIPPVHRLLFTAIPADVFRLDVSSSQLRAEQD